MIKIVNEDIFYEMSKLTQKYADEELCGDFGEFIYFSPCLDSHGPRVKFYGGTKETSTIRNAPTLAFTNNGETTIELAAWMNKKNCPNAFDNNYIQKISDFIQKFLPILLLVWYGKLDESDALKYFEGDLSLENLLLCVTDTDKDITKYKELKSLHDFCINNNIYKF